MSLAALIVMVSVITIVVGVLFATAAVGNDEMGGSTVISEARRAVHR